MKLLIMQFSPISRHFIPLRTKCPCGDLKWNVSRTSEKHYHSKQTARPQEKSGSTRQSAPRGKCSYCDVTVAASSQLNPFTILQWANCSFFFLLLRLRKCGDYRMSVN
jgi:hypothetical protein